FPAGDNFLALMDQSEAFKERRAIKLTGGIAYVYVGVVQ
ncbi:MAG TPA: ubiquinone biosynthesis protein UbiE, partial [Balneolaceae bacterium]|nr:ubiquinone biosynthesis protein UbiE [Balneolaceae bacterium]